MDSKKIFVIEHCDGTAIHQWHTRLDETKYQMYANETAAAIKAAVPNCEVVFNKVPKVHAMSEIYCQLI